MREKKLYKLVDVYDGYEVILFSDDLDEINQVARSYDEDDCDGECDLIVYQYNGVCYMVLKDWKY